MRIGTNYIRWIMVSQVYMQSTDIIAHPYNLSIYITLRYPPSLYHTNRSSLRIPNIHTTLQRLTYRHVRIWVNVLWGFNLIFFFLNFRHSLMGRSCPEHRQFFAFQLLNIFFPFFLLIACGYCTIGDQTCGREQSMHNNNV